MADFASIIRDSSKQTGLSQEQTALITLYYLHFDLMEVPKGYKEHIKPIIRDGILEFANEILEREEKEDASN